MYFLVYLLLKDRALSVPVKTSFLLRGGKSGCTHNKTLYSEVTDSVSSLLDYLIRLVVSNALGFLDYTPT